MPSTPRASLTIKSRPRTDGSVSWFLWIRRQRPERDELIPVDRYTRLEDRPLVEEFAKPYRAALAAGTSGPKHETADDWYDRFVKTRMGKISTASADHAQWLKWISPTIGHRAMIDVTADDVEAVRDVLDVAVDEWEASGKVRGNGLAFSTAGNVWAILTLAMKHASTRAGDRKLRVREAQGNPCLGIRPPKMGAAKRRHWLRPAEVSAYLACEKPEVPLAWREAVAIGLYLHLRPGELQELRAKDVNLDAGEVVISRAWDEGKGKAKAPKTNEGLRVVAIPATLMPLVRRLVKDADGEKLLAPVIAETAEDNRAKIFRVQLKAAGVAREELFVDSGTHEGIDFRTIRDTGITWRFLAGARAEHVQREAGHRELSTTLGYAKEVDNRGGRFGEPFPALPFAPLPKPDPTPSQASDPRVGRDVNGVNRNPVFPEKLVARVGFEPTTFGL